MLSLAGAVIAVAALVACCWFSYWVGYTRKLRADEGFRFGKAEGYRIGRVEGEHERDELREQLAEAASTLDATMENFAGYVEDHANTYPPTTWSDAVAPGGQVCAVPMPDLPDGICGFPVESAPCPDHTCRCLADVDATYANAREISISHHERTRP